MSRRLARASETERAPKRAVSHAIETSKASLNTTWTESSRLDGNNVDMDQEQVEIVRTAYQYQYMLNSITNDINRLRTAAKTF